LPASIVAGLLFLFATSASAADTSSRVPLPTIAVDKTTRCIEPPDVMRRTHMEMLRHQRDRTVRDGVRGAKASLAACVECHAGTGAGVAAGSVAGSPQAFCESCHRYAAVKLDCFECHQARTAAALAAAGKR
jgi:[DsrC]-trisulfide reductase subunit J